MASHNDLLPDDSFNRALVANVHPVDWENPRPDRRYNLVVIGAGTAGLVTAMGAAGLGAKVALVEKHLMGGDCLNFGCVPSKALLRSARALGQVRDTGEFGVQVPPGTAVDFALVMERMRRLRSEISHNDSAKRFRDAGVDVFLGEAKFNGSDTLQVAGPAGNRVLPFRKAVIATGTRPVVPQIPGLAEAGCLTNESVFSLTALPRRLAVIGGGPVGCELAQAFARFGSQVVLLEQQDRLLPSEDPDAAQIVAGALARDGVEALTGCRILRVRGADSGKAITFRRAAEEREVLADEILIGAGRAPNVRGMNLEAVGVRYDERVGIHVDDYLRTTNRDVYACGDVCSQYKFTHTADFSARIVIQNALFFGRARASALVIPWCTYTDPEVAHVGLSEREAREQGIAIQTLRQDLVDVDRAILDAETAGFVKVHLRKGTDKIVGATIVAAHAGEMISELTLAIAAGVGLKTIGKTIHPYPTQAEAIRKLGDQFNRQRLTPRIQALFRAFLSWRR